MNGDPYLDSHSGVLLNKFGLSDHDALARGEQALGLFVWPDSNLT